MIVGTSRIEAGLDTGSVGLRVLRRAIGENDASTTADARSMVYAVGTMLDGVGATAEVGIGAPSLHGRSDLEVINRVGCTQQRPQCPASRIDPRHFGIMGNGVADEGFPAIMGLGVAETDVANPLIALGIKRWIVELPLPGSGSPGRLILNPSDEEMDGYVFFPHGRSQVSRAMRFGIPVCLSSRSHEQSICGYALLDTGLFGMRLRGGESALQWPSGMPVTLAVSPHHDALAMQFTIGAGEQAESLVLGSEISGEPPVLFAGVLPYYAFSVLYDVENGRIGLRPRSDSPFVLAQGSPRP